LNLAWRTVVAEGSANRIGIARAVIYFQKEPALNFVRQKINAHELLANAVIFAVDNDGPLQLVSFEPRETKPDYRPAIREDNLAATSVGSKAAQAADSGAGVADTKLKTEGNAEIAKADPAAVAEQKPSGKSAKPNRTESPAAAKLAPATAQARQALPGATNEAAVKPAQTQEAGRDAARTESPARKDKAEPVTTPPPAAKTSPAPAKVAPVPEEKSEKSKPAVPAAEIASKTPATSTPVLPSDGAGKARPAESAITAIKPALDVKKNQPAAKSVAERSQEAAPAATVAMAANLAKAKSQDEELQRQESVAAPSASLKAPVSAGGESDVIAPAAVARLESREVSAEQSGAADSEPARAVAAEEKAAPVSPAPEPIPEVKQAQEPDGAGVPTPGASAKTTLAPPAPAAVKLPEAEKTETGVAPRSTAKSPEAGISPEPPKTPPAISVAKDETESIQAAAPEAPAPVEEKTVEKPAPEQLASIPKPIEATVETSALARPVPKPLEGFIIQIAFRDKEKAQSWAEKMAQRGYAVSVTAAGSEGSLRVRLGNFGLRDEAERQLKNFKQDGMNGIIINLPQAFRPGAASSVP
jgi:cell division septation protein DedD